MIDLLGRAKETRGGEKTTRRTKETTRGRRKKETKRKRRGRETKS